MPGNGCVPRIAGGQGEAIGRIAATWALSSPRQAGMPHKVDRLPMTLSSRRRTVTIRHCLDLCRARFQSPATPSPFLMPFFVGS